MTSLHTQLVEEHDEIEDAVGLSLLARYHKGDSGRDDNLEPRMSNAMRTYMTALSKRLAATVNTAEWLIEQKDKLDKRIADLSDGGEGLPDAERELIAQQKAAMVELSEVWGLQIQAIDAKVNQERTVQ